MNLLSVGCLREWKGEEEQEIRSKIDVQVYLFEEYCGKVFDLDCIPAKKWPSLHNMLCMLIKVIQFGSCKNKN